MSIRDRPLGDEFRKCDNCKNTRGFHSSFLKDGEKYKVILICPECDSRYDIGWNIEI